MVTEADAFRRMVVEREKWILEFCSTVWMNKRGKFGGWMAIFIFPPLTQRDF